MNELLYSVKIYFINISIFPILYWNTYYLFFLLFFFIFILCNRVNLVTKGITGDMQHVFSTFRKNYVLKSLKFIEIYLLDLMYL